LLEHAFLVNDASDGQLVLVRHAQQGANTLADSARPKAGDATRTDLGRRQAEAAALEPPAAFRSTPCHGDLHRLIDACPEQADRALPAAPRGRHRTESTSRRRSRSSFCDRARSIPGDVLSVSGGYAMRK
jgi:hypothetical protein